MAIYNVTINPGSNAQPASVHGTVGWSGDPLHVQTLNMDPGAGSTWIIWQIGATGINPGEPVNAVQISGSHFFNVYGGGGYARQCTLYCKTATTLAGITGSGDGVATIPGNANTHGVNNVGVPTPVGLTSTNLLNGQFFLGYAVKTSSDQPLFGPGVYSTTALSFKFYTGPDNPNPPPNAPYGTLTNPTSNMTPGKPSGGQFSPLTFQLISPLPQTFITISFETSHTGLRFSNGNQIMSLNKGLNNDPANPYIGVCSPIDINPTLAGGTYGVKAGIASIGGGSIVLSASLVVVSNTNQGFFMEF